MNFANARLLIIFACLSAYAQNHAKLVEVQKISPTIVVELYFASDTNFLGKALYPKNAKAYLLEEVALALDKVQHELARFGYGLKIMDALRPMWAQKKLWEGVLAINIKNPENYVSNPYDENEGGRHTRGTAIDVRLINLSDGSELSMPPLSFAQEAHQGCITNLTADQIKNREFLKAIMMHHGFTPIRCEWWHYDYPGWRNFASIDKSFDEIEQEIF